MNKTIKYSTSVFLLLVYVPVILIATFVHQHESNLPVAEQQIEIPVDDLTLTDSGSHLFCAICNFINSHSTPNMLSWDSSIQMQSLSFRADNAFFAIQNVDFAIPRAPPFLS